ncbi:MAG TPA: restriction endonuclease [Candidatus Angelobacter sp.]
MTQKVQLSIGSMKNAAKDFLLQASRTPVKHLYGVTDGKAVGTHVEHAFHVHLSETYDYVVGSSASGIDFPEINVDLKVTSLKQPQSSCPFRDASQKVYGLGYSLIVFVYEKVDDAKSQTALLTFQHAVFVDKERTADFQTTFGLLQTLKNGGNEDDIVAFLEDKNLPLEEVGRRLLAEKIITQPPQQGFLTISNALQWRLQYGRVVAEAGKVDGVEKLLE